MKYQKPTIEQSLYFLALILAAGLRFISLGKEALSDPEAALALQSLGLVRGSSLPIGPHPGYILPTAVLDFIFGATNFTARLWPVICGLLLILVVYLLRDTLGRVAGIALAFWIALDPSLVAVARQAGTSGIGLVFVLLALASWLRGKTVWAGVWAGLAVLGGPLVWPNLLLMAIAAWLVDRKFWKTTWAAGAINGRTFGVSFFASLILVGTLVLLVPGGLSGAAASIPAYIQGWSGTSSVPILRLVGALVAYEVLGLVLGLAGVVSGGLIARNRIDGFLGIWWAFSLLAALAYPSRQVLDLVWPMLPMLLLAARQVPRMLQISAEERLSTLGQAILVLFLLILVANLAISWPAVETQSGNQVYRVLVMSVAVFLIIAETTLVVWGWSRQVGLYGLSWGISGLFFLLTISNLANAAGFSGRPPAEMWRSGANFAEADLFIQTVKDQSAWMPDSTRAPEIMIADLGSPALEWILRDQPGLKVSGSLPVDSSPSILVTTDRTELGLSARYTGQAFTLAKSPAWDLISPSEWLNWLVFRSLKKETWTTTNLILWVRSDLFPGAAPVPAITP